MPLGRWGRFPFRFGGEQPVEEIAAGAMLKALSPEPGVGFDRTDPMLEAEVNSHAGVIATIWSVNERVTNSAIPPLMMESLPEAEEAYGIRPTPNQSDAERRAVVAGKKLTSSSNRRGDIEDAVRAIAKTQFVALNVADEATQVYAWWPGGDPGFPGMEWASNRMHYQVSLTKAGLPDDASFARLRAAVENLLHAILPASHTFSVNTGIGFVIGESLLGEAAI